MPEVLRRRVPFAFKSEDAFDGNDQVVLDEQGNPHSFRLVLKHSPYVATEQTELVEQIKEHNAAANKQNRLALQAMLGLSGLLCVLIVLHV